MVIQDCAYYEGKRWFAYELKDISGNYHEEYRLKMRMESQKNAFTCPDCGEPLILCAGPVMEPFFKHHEGSKCIVRDFSRNQKNCVAKRQIYHLLKQSFPQREILSNVIPEEGICLDFVIELEEHPAIAVKYLASIPKLEKLEQEYETLQMLGYQPIYILKYREQYKNRRFTTFEYLVSKLEGEVRYLEIDTHSLIVKKMLRIEGREFLKEKQYPLVELLVREDGSFTHDLPELLQQEKRAYEEELEWDRQYVAQNRAIVYEERIQEIEERRQEKEQLIELQSFHEVTRQPMEQDVSMKNKMKFFSLGEIWTIPRLYGRDYRVKKADVIRYQYLKTLDRRLFDIEDAEQREREIARAIQRLEKDTDAEVWIDRA